MSMTQAPKPARPIALVPALLPALLLTLLLGASASLAAQTTVDGVIFANYRYGLETDSSYTPTARQNNFDIERAYLNVRSKTDGGVSTRLTIDIDGRRANAGQLSFRLKYAYVAWTPAGSSLTWTLGMQGTPQVGFEDELWGYRMQGPNPLDRARYLPSADIGAAVAGAWQKQRVNMDVGVFNGESFSRAPGDNRKDVAGRVSVRLLETNNASRTGGLRLTGFAQLGKATGGSDRTRAVGTLSYSTNALTLGTQYAVMQDSTLASPETKGRLISVFGTYNLKDRPVGFMGRVDRLDPDRDRNPTVASLDASEQTRVIAGVTYQLAKNVKLLLDADVVSLQNGPGPNSFQAANRSLYLHAEIKY